MRRLARFLSNEDGATAIEYALIAATTGLVLIAVMPAVGSSLNGVFTSLANGL